MKAPLGAFFFCAQIALNFLTIQSFNIQFDLI